MINVPHSIVDFAAALKLLAESQSDVAEIVTQWDLICNTETPRTVTVRLSSGVHEVDNLAKIRNDLIKGLSLDKPQVTEIRFKSVRSSGTINATQHFSEAWYDIGDDAYEKNSPGWRSIGRFIGNDLRTMCIPDAVNMSVSMVNLERLIFLGFAPDGSGGYATEYTISISAPPAEYADRLSESRQHYTQVTFVNKSPSQSTVILKIVFDPYSANGYVLRAIPYPYSVTYFVWASISQNSVYVHEYVPDLTGGA